MKTIENHDVKIYTDHIEEVAMGQIEELLAIGTFGGCKIRIMPDVHAGAGCVIGFTGDMGDKVIPNIVGVDIGCGISVQPFRVTCPIPYHALNEYILQTIPCGRDFRDKRYKPLPEQYMEGYREAKEVVNSMYCYRELQKIKRLHLSIGTLGGGNHFIEVDHDTEGQHYLLVHTGSRNLGKQVANIYQDLAVRMLSGWGDVMVMQKQMIAEYKASGRKKELQKAIEDLHARFEMRQCPIPNALAYLEGEGREHYLHDMRLCQRWAEINRMIISGLLSDFLVKECGAEMDSGGCFESVHNYIGADNIIRKGAISARDGERCIIPMNMRDGALICIGKGNADWNYSAPHGAGRLMSRKKAFEVLQMEDFEASMTGIYSETLSRSTIDEAPMVYKPKEEIIANIHDTVEIERHIKPLYNFKAAE